MTGERGLNQGFGDMKNKRSKRFIASLLAAGVIGTALPPPALAGMVGTDTVAAAAARDRVASALQRADAASQIEHLGVRRSDVQARVDALTDEEVVQLATRLDSLPAGGNAVIGAVLVVFLVLLITDIMGVTKVFPFTRPIR